MAKPLRPFVRGGGYYPSKKWIPLVRNGGYTTQNGGETEPVWATVSGAIASFTTPFAYPLKKLMAQINPVQDLHGQSSPYPAGGCKNKCDGIAYDGAISSNIPRISNKTPITSPHNISTGFGGVCFFAKVESGKTYALSSDETGSSATFYWAIYSSIDDALNITNALQSGSTNVSFTAEHDGYVLFMRYNTTAGTSVTWTYAQAEVGSSATAYAPYSNICPISGWTGLSCYRTGINVWDEEWENGTFNTTTGANIDVSSVLNQIRAKNLIPIIPWVFYRINADVAIWCIFYDSDGNVSTERLPAGRGDPSDGNSFLLGGQFNTTFQAQGNYHYMRFYCQNAYGSTYNHDISINLPSTDTAYHSGTANEAISVSFGQAIYGGTDEVIGGNGTSTMGKIVFDGTQSILATNWQPKENSVAWCYYYSLTNHAFSTSLSNVPNFLASSCPVVSTGEAIIGYHPQLLEVSCYNASSPIGIIFRTTDMTLTTASAINAYLAENPVTLVYELATPQSFTHDPVPVDTLYGQNNVWVTSGDVEVTYRIG